MRPADRLTYGEQSKSALWLTRGKMFIIRQTGYDASKQFGQFFGEKYYVNFKINAKSLKGFTPLDGRNFCLARFSTQILCFLKSGEKIFFPEKNFFPEIWGKNFFS